MEVYNSCNIKCIVALKKKKEKITVCHKYVSKPYLIFFSSKTSFMSCPVLVKIIKFY